MKKILSIVLAVLLVPQSVWAIVAPDTSTVWFKSVPTATGQELAPKIGDPILIYTAITNDTKDSITYTLSYGASEKTIGTKTTTIPGYTEQAPSFAWTIPQTPTTVTATITKAIGKDKKQLPALTGVVGSVLISVNPSTPMPEIGAQAKGFIGKGIAFVEAFRLRQLEYFTKLKVRNKDILGETTVNDISGLLQPEVPAVPGGETPPPQIKDAQTMQYLTLLYATAGQSFFGHRVFFYIVTVLAVLFVIRFIFRRFS